MDQKPPRYLYQFGPFLLDPGERRLLREGKAVHLTPKVFETLLVLVENNGSVVEKDRLMTELWPNTVVEEGNLTVNVSILRKILNGFGDACIETIPKRGYRFAGAVQKRSTDEAKPQQAVSAMEAAAPAEPAATETGGRPSRPVENLPGGASELSSVEWRKVKIEKNVTPSTGAGFRLMAALVVALALAAAVYLFWNHQPPNAVQPVKSIAVMPFKPIGADDRHTYLGLGLADALITRLGNIDKLVVRPTDAVRRFDRQEVDASKAGRELGVDAVLAGTFQRFEERIRVTVQLVRVSDGASIWGGKFDERITDIFSLQDQISESIAGSLLSGLTSRERELLLKPYTQDPAAYELYLKGRYYWNLDTPEWIQVGISFFNRAIERDSKFALAYAGLADAYAIPASGLSPKERYPKARDAASKALEIDPTLAEAHTSLGYLKYRSEWDWLGAEKEFQKALELKPNYALAHRRYGEFLGLTGHADESIASLQRAAELDPVSLPIKTALCESLYRARRFDDAIGACRQALELDANYWRPHRVIAWSLEAQGKDPEAVENHLQAELLLKTPLERVTELRETYIRSGMQEFRKAQLELTVEKVEKRHVLPFAIPYRMATIYARLGRKEKAFEWLQKSCDERNEGALQLKVDPKLDSLRSDPRFETLMARVGFP